MSVADTARDLRAIAQRLADMSPILRVVGEDIRTETDNAFAQSRSPQGEPWAPLSAATEAINPRRVGGSPLNDTGRLRGSITYSAQPRSLSFGTNVRYAAAQQFGNPANRLFGRRPAPVPARPFLPVSPDGQLSPDSFWDDARARIEHWLATGEVR